MCSWWCLVLLALAAQAAVLAHAVSFPGGPVAPAQARECLLRQFNSTTLRDHNVFSQAGEDGILETVFMCIGTTNKRYVEFGVESGVECSTRYLRENHNFTGLMMDGSNYRPEINLQKEMIYSHNITKLFVKYNVSHPSFDQLTVDVDLNSFWVALAILCGGYRPRSFTVEYNRNLRWTDEYATVDLPNDWWRGDCYYGATAGAYVNVMTSFGYHLVAADRLGVNLFFVHESVVGQQPLFTLADAKLLFSGNREHGALHSDCYFHPWVKIGRHVDYTRLDAAHKLPMALLSYTLAGQVREFYELKEVYPGEQCQRIRMPRHVGPPAEITSTWHQPRRTTGSAAAWLLAMVVLACIAALVLATRVKPPTHAI